MKRNLAFFTFVFVLITASAIIFLKAYDELTDYIDVSNRRNAVLQNFQELFRQIKNAAVSNPELEQKNSSFSTSKKLFHADSSLIVSLLNNLDNLVRDSVNMRITDSLRMLVPREISWLIRSNVPDSIASSASPVHIAIYRRIETLCMEGITRTRHIVAISRLQLAEEAKIIGYWMVGVILISVFLAAYSSMKLIREQTATETQKKELATTLNRMSDAVLSLDHSWRFTFLNNAAMQQLGKDSKEVVGSTLWEIVPGIKDTIFAEKYREAMLTSIPQEIDSAYYPDDGNWYSVKAYPASDGLTIFLKNITKTKESEQQLFHTLQEIRDYKYALDESSIVAITDQRGRITYVNDNFCKISKYTREELLGQDHRIINSSFHSTEFIRNLWVTIARGKIWKGEMRNRAKDGTIYWVDTTIVPFLNKENKPYQYVAIRADITERKLAEEKLLKSEKIYKTIASSIPGSIICLLDREYQYLLIEGDMLSMIGYSKDQLLGKKAWDVFPESLMNEVSPYLEKAFAGSIVTRESGANGYDIVSRYIPLKDENDNVYAIMTVAIDVSKLKTAQRSLLKLNDELEERIAQRTAELKRSTDEMEAFSYSVSHDLRAPLRGIIGFASILEEDYSSKLDDDGRRVISVIKENTLKMGNLIDDLLAFSRLGKTPISRSVVDMNEVVSGIIREFSASAANVQWKTRPLRPADADLTTIRQVWINLISNAIKYSRTKEIINIETGCIVEKKQSIYYVRDNGVGFDNAYREKLFKVFQRLHDSEEFEGTGVGLAIVEKIISRHGGKVWAEGKENEGACFYFSLPLKKEI